MGNTAYNPAAQVDLLAEKILDSFAGGGGASTGIELATGRVVTWAINHDPDAIRQHKANHPYTEHFQASVWDLDPMEITKGQPVGLAWFSPDCKHFSKAKGAALRDRKIRGLAWIVLRWAGTVRPRVIMLENVEEFQTWGPVRKGKPVKKKTGQTFHKFISQLEDLGYQVEYRELVAADYGAPTTRKRFVLVARCDGKPIVWPEPTHAPRDSEAVKSGKRKPWRSAAEIIDWTIPGYSIFAYKAEIKEKYGVNVVRPLADNTLRRVIRGVDKFTIKSGEPFIVPTGYGERSGQAPRVMDINEPVGTVVGRDKFTVCEPVVAPFTFSNTGGSVGAAVSEPVYTVRTGGGGDPFLASVINRAIGCVGNQETVDAVPVEDIEKWLWEIALNNTGITQDISDTCEMIIDRLDGLRTFSRERKYKTEFITRNHGNREFEVIIKTDNKEHYEAAQSVARRLIDHDVPNSEVKMPNLMDAMWEGYQKWLGEMEEIHG